MRGPPPFRIVRLLFLIVATGFTSASCGSCDALSQLPQPPLPRSILLPLLTSQNSSRFSLSRSFSSISLELDDAATNSFCTS